LNQIEISSSRLKLRLVTLSDLNVIHRLHSLAETDAFNTLGIPDSLAVTKLIVDTWILDNQQLNINNYTFAIELKLSQQFIGLIALKLGSAKFKRAEVWYKLHVASWGKGFGSEALNRILDFGFGELKLHRIEAGCAVNNIGSIRVLEKVGMIREGRKRQVLPLKTGWSDNFEYAIIETDPRYPSSM